MKLVVLIDTHFISLSSVEEKEMILIGFNKSKLSVSLLKNFKQ